MRRLVASVTVLMQNGTMIETATIGYEGVIADCALFGGDIAASENMLQVPDGVRVRRVDMARELQILAYYAAGAGPS